VTSREYLAAKSLEPRAKSLEGRCAAF